MWRLYPACLVVIVSYIIPVNLLCTETATDPVTSTSYCLLAGTAPTSTQHAVEACTEHGYFLVSIDSQTEHNFLSSQMWWSKHGVTAYWLRVMHRPGYRDEWLKWLDCRAPTWTNWESVTESDGSLYNTSDACAYVVTSSAHRWRSGLCDSTVPDVVVCEKVKDNCLIHADDLVHERQYCYMTHQSTYTQAHRLCTALGYSLAQFETSDEMQQVFGLFAGKNVVCFSYTHYWLGLEATGGTWGWADGTPVTWTHWEGALPDGTEPGCGAARSANDHWVAAPCSQQHVFLCERSTVVSDPNQSVMSAVLDLAPIAVDPPANIPPTTVTEPVTEDTPAETTTIMTTETITEAAVTTQNSTVTNSTPVNSGPIRRSFVVNVISGENSVTSAETDTDTMYTTQKTQEPSVVSCGELPDSPHRMVSSQQRALGAVVTLHCSPGYVFDTPEGTTSTSSSTEITTRCQADGHWLPAPPNCSAISCPPVPVWNSLIPDTTDRKYLTVVNVSCQPDFRFPGGHTYRVSTCREGGNWVPAFSSCEKDTYHSAYPTTEATHGALIAGIGAVLLVAWLILLLYLDVRLFRKPPSPRRKRKKKKTLEKYRNNRVVPVHDTSTPLPAGPPGGQVPPPGSPRRRPGLTVFEGMEEGVEGGTVVERLEEGEDGGEGEVHLVNVPDHPDNANNTMSSMTVLL